MEGESERVNRRERGREIERESSVDLLIREL
jgi:hypothetical protein